MRRPKTDKRVWHVFARGVRRLALFYEDFDYLKFLSLLREACTASGCALYAYCLMANHYHLMLMATSVQLSHCMWLVNRKYALHHNARHRMGGHVFEGPYRAYKQKTARSIFWRLAYVFLNPVMAGLVDRPEQYRWSGFLSFMGLEGSPLPVSLPEGFDALCGGSDRARAQFMSVLEEQLRHGKRQTGGPTALEVNCEQFAWLLRRAEDRKARWPCEDPVSIALYWGRESGIPPRAMAKALGITDVSRLRRRIHAFAQRISKESDLAERVGQP